jgi:dephospho-CoA kinase
MIIGVAGNYASGKDTVAEILQELGFKHISFSDMIRQEITRREQEITRDRLIEVGNDMRERWGADILAKKALEKVEDGDYVFTSIRNPSEVKLLKKRRDFTLIKVTAPDKIRLKRIVERNRENDPKTMEELHEKEAKENSKDPKAQQLNTVISMATHELVNDSTIDELKEKVKDLLTTIKNA